MMIMVLFGFALPLFLIILFYGMTKNIIDNRGKKMYNSYSPGDRSVRQLNNSLMSEPESARKLNKSLISLPESAQMNIVTAYPIMRTSKNNQMSRHKMLLSFSKSETNIQNELQNEVYLRRNLNTLMNSESKLLKMIMLNVTCFVIAWLPYTIIVLIAQFASNTEKYVTPYSTTLPAVFSKMSSIYNPLLYTLTNRECRTYFKKFFKKK
jgi:hypothetical protein